MIVCNFCLNKPIVAAVDARGTMCGLLFVEHMLAKTLSRCSLVGFAWRSGQHPAGFDMFFGKRHKHYYHIAYVIGLLCLHDS